MLNKDICRKCVDTILPVGQWGEHQDQQWDRGEVLCPPVLHLLHDYSCVLTLTTSINKNCPYMLEQAVAAGMEKK